MCGIFGLWNFSQQPIAPLAVQQATALLRHRGPDDEGYLLVNTRTGSLSSWGGNDTMAELQLTRIEKCAEHSANLAFGFRRLAILDLSAAGHQPMSDAHGRCWIIFNGEIYNYLELREELARHGCRFRTGSDTEVILAAYHRWGRECLERFNGMWAFALWDGERRELFCARDRLGIKPFYYFFDEERFVFASEIKAILSVLPQTREVNRPYLAEFLTGGALDYGEETFFQKIKSLPPAHFFIITADTRALAPQRFWDVDPEAVKSKYDYARPRETFLELLNDAVRLRLRSDVPVGTCLSGGLDSSALVALAARMLPHAMNTFSSIYAPAGYSEEHYIRLVAQAHQTRSHFTAPEPEKFFEILPRLIWHMDEPVAGPGVYSQWFVMALARGNVTVLLDGQGGDELFAGYFFYLPIHLRTLMRKMQKPPRLQTFGRVLQDGWAFARESRRYFFPQLTPRQFARKALRKFRGRRDRSNLLLHAEFSRTHAPRFTHNPMPSQDLLNRRLYQDLTRTSIPALLHYEDRNSMAFSIEARVPLLDYRLVEFALCLPGETKIRGTVTKYFVREALKDILPEPIRGRRDKMGYPTPLAVWLRGPLKKEAEDFLAEHGARRHLYNPSTLQNLWREHLRGRDDHSWLLFRVMATEMWFQNFIDASP